MTACTAVSAKAEENEEIASFIIIKFYQLSGES